MMAHYRQPRRRLGGVRGTAARRWLYDTQTAARAVADLHGKPVRGGRGGAADARPTEVALPRPPRRGVPGGAGAAGPLLPAPGCQAGPRLRPRAGPRPLRPGGLPPLLRAGGRVVRASTTDPDAAPMSSGGALL